ncbi:MAG: TerB N-terminal domain-containing protein [Clostridia bacterium]|nr:TerB N-terminal domain-containing protein [Clostridia bacterium]
MGKERDSFDDFWDIEKLIPKKKKSPDFFLHTYDTEPVEVILTAKESTSAGKLTTFEMRPAEDESKLSFTPKSEEKTVPNDEYSPENPFIKSVKIFRRDDFGYYNAFYNDGIKYLNIKGSECTEKSFFSWVPQYSQLDDTQLNFYFFLRENLRHKKTINASYSYILLYIFELINVEPDKDHALTQLSFIWQGYRDKFPKLDMLLREWITDYCLIHHLAPSSDKLGSAYLYAIETSTLKEFFIFSGKSEEEMIASSELASALLKLCTNYDWKKSKFAVGENITIYKTHILGALQAVLATMSGRQDVFIGVGELKRDAFAGALCTPNNKCRIEVNYCSIARSHEMRFLITDVIKHAENKIRAYLGIKSRLTVYSLPTGVRSAIDEYMEKVLGTRPAPKKTEEPQEYDKLYDVPVREFSLETAKKIEESSWNTTKLLIEAFGGEENSENDILTPEKSVQINESLILNDSQTDEEKLLSAMTNYKDFIDAALSCDLAKQSAVAIKKGRLIDALADEINEIAADIFGDIILEKKTECYTVIDDYREVFENACDE